MINSPDVINTKKKTVLEAINDTSEGEKSFF